MSGLESESRILGKLLGSSVTRRARWDLLVFWGRFPGGWYTRAAIDPVTTEPKYQIERALQELVEDGVVDLHRDTYGEYYALTDAPQILSAIRRLCTLSPNARRLVMSRFLGRASQSHEPRSLVPSISADFDSTC